MPTRQDTVEDVRDSRVTLPTDLYDQIQRTAADDERSMHKQMIWLMRQGLAARARALARSTAAA